MKFSLKTGLIFTFFFALTAHAQTGSIKGILFDSSTHTGIVGTIDIFALNKTSKSLSNGEFTIDSLPNGVYSLFIQADGFKYKTVYNAKVSNGKKVIMDTIYLKSNITTLRKFGVTFTRTKTTVAEGIKEQKESEQVVNVVTAETMTKGQDGDAAKVAARVPGVTLIENRFIILRGLGQRYNSVQINNVNAPSTEVDRRAFSFDLIPSNMLDKMVIFKSPSSDLAGDFAGGDIKLQTKSEINKDFISYNIGFGYRLNTSLMSHQNNSVGSLSDYFGFDNGSRALPASFPASLSNSSTAQRIELGKQLNNNYKLGSMYTPLDFGLGFGFGHNIKLKNKGMRLYTVNNFSYGTNYQYAGMKRYRYQNDPVETVRQMFNYSDQNFSIESKFNILSNWIFEKNKYSTYTFRNLFNQIGENETTIRTGVNPTERPNDEWKNYSYHYTSRSIYFGQFEGTHRFGKREKIIHTFGYSNVSRDEPDYRRFRTVRPIGSNATYNMVDPPSANLFDAARFYSKLKENTFSFNFLYENHFIVDSVKKKEIVLRAGSYAEYKARSFDARWFGYKYSGDPQLKTAFLQSPIDQIFGAENINTTSGFKPEEGTNPSDRYDAQNQLLAGFVNASIPYKEFNFNLGVRYEYFNQGLQSATQNGKIDVVLKNPNILPSINASYNFDEKNLIRMAYGKSVNRPEFRELAPFVYYDFMYDVNIVGNPNLKSATIDNLDMRFENYPSKNETVSLGVFYKRFLNPIENYVQPIGLSQQYSLGNAKNAINMGAELEYRKSFENATQNNFFKYTSVLINASYIVSKVDLGADSTLSQARTRPLQGQSPYIVNAAFQYQNDSSVTFNIVYNVYGKRIVYVGNNVFPTVYEMPRHAIDFTITKPLTKNFTLKFGVTDILNFKHQLWQDTNGDNVINYKNGKDHQLLEYRRGQMFSLSISYKITKK